MSKKRRKAVKVDAEKLYDTAPVDIALSYSARIVLEKALDVLSSVLEFRCGLDQKVARDMLIRATIDKGYESYKTLKDVAGAESGLSSGRFQEIFGERRRAAAEVVDGGTIEYMPPSNDIGSRRPTKEDYDYAASLEDVTNRRAAEIRQRKTRGRRKNATSATKIDRRTVKILSSNEEIYKKLKAELPETPTTLTVFNLAAGVLDDPEDLKITAKLWLVRREHRISHNQMQLDLKLSSEDYIKRLQAIKKTLEEKAKERNLKAFKHVSLKFPNESRRNRTGSGRTKEILISAEMQKAKDIFQANVSSDPAHRSVFNLVARTFTLTAELATASSLWLASPEHKMTHTQVRKKLKLEEPKYNKFVKDIFSKLKDAASRENLRAFTKVKFDFSDAQRNAGHSTTYSIDETQMPVSDASVAKGPI